MDQAPAAPNDVHVYFRDLEDKSAAAQRLLRQAGDEAQLIRTTGDAFVIPAELATKLGLLDADGHTVTVGPELGKAPEAPAPAPVTSDWNPGEHNVEDVLKRLNDPETSFDEQVRIITAEQEGKNRTTIARWSAPTPKTVEPVEPVTPSTPEGETGTEVELQPGETGDGTTEQPPAGQETPPNE